MEKRMRGNGSLEVSAFGLGCMGRSFGDGPAADRHETIARLRPAVEGPFDVDVVSAAVSALFDKIGPGILVSHSQSGGPGWRTAMKSQNVRAIVAYEPGSNFIFPEGNVPPPIPSSFGPLEALGAPLTEFMLLTKIPIAPDLVPEGAFASSSDS